ncbi:MAG: hypothetical protein H6799_00250 [Candidatus Nomurabacteria bacterium]|nr:MAG: hypothetical protein H6799_00250 [Candidatus Nomurabacteria bacterium]HRV76017.1 hypothetical protein [Candidatus Saccharimonadales bacterium]
MTYIPRRLRPLIITPRGKLDEDITLAELDREMDNHLDENASILLPVTGLLRRCSKVLPREVRPKSMLEIGLGFLALSNVTSIKTRSRILVGLIGTGAIALAWDAKCLEETELEEGVVIKEGVPRDEAPLTSKDWRNMSTMLGLASIYGDAIGLSPTKRALAFGGSIGASFMAGLVAPQEVDVVALEAARTIY